jgi:hypothetical protein
MKRAKSVRTPPPSRPLGEHLTAAALAVGALTAIVLLLIASLATSRANGHVLSPAAVIAVVVGVAMALVSVGWANGLYGGADDVLSGRVTFTCEPGCASEPASDPWQSGRLWRGIVTAALLAGVWAGATAGLVAVVLDAGRAPFVVLSATLVGSVAVAAAVVDVVARHRGAHAARAITRNGTVPTPLRQRAWREIAVPLGLTQLLVNGAAAWMLFHDYTASDGARALTASVITDDFPVVAIIVAAYFGMTATRWGRVDAALGRVSLDDPAAQTVDRRAPIGPQALVYIAPAIIVAANVGSFLVPAHPSLLVAAIVRGGFAAVGTTLAAAAGYVRGAVNEGARRHEALEVAA